MPTELWHVEWISNLVKAMFFANYDDAVSFAQERADTTRKQVRVTKVTVPELNAQTITAILNGNLEMVEWSEENQIVLHAQGRMALI
jgi:hypothetical protein